jgi:hypothetical protein
LFDLRTKCSDLARRIEQEAKTANRTSRLGADDIVSVTNRYDPAANRCYVEQFTTHYQKAINGESQVMQDRIVTDAQENLALVSCNDYVHGSEPHRTTCLDKSLKTIPVDDANARMNSLMEESVEWP